jgi:acyl carrier protein
MNNSNIIESTRKIWEEVLKIPITNSTDFFWEGGYSFLALDIIAHTEQALHIKVPLRMLFDHPCFDDFVASLEKLIHSGENQ